VLVSLWELAILYGVIFFKDTRDGKNMRDSFFKLLITLARIIREEIQSFSGKESLLTQAF
jgi:hypothetical protein